MTRVLPATAYPATGGVCHTPTTYPPHCGGSAGGGGPSVPEAMSAGWDVLAYSTGALEDASRDPAVNHGDDVASWMTEDSVAISTGGVNSVVDLSIDPPGVSINGERTIWFHAGYGGLPVPLTYAGPFAAYWVGRLGDVVNVGYFGEASAAGSTGMIAMNTGIRGWIRTATTQVLPDHPAAPLVEGEDRVLIWTRDANNDVRFYVDGVLAWTTNCPGDMKIGELNRVVLSWANSAHMVAAGLYGLDHEADDGAVRTANASYLLNRYLPAA